MGTERSVFWDDLVNDMADPEFLRAYVVESMRIATIDRIINDLDQARETAGLSKAALARAIGSEPAVIRRLFAAGKVNPTLGTLTEVAAALGLRITLEPMPEREQEDITAPLISGEHSDRKALARHLTDMRSANPAA